MGKPSSKPSDRSPLRPGDVVASAYRVEKVLGAGAMGAVVAAVDLRTEAQVAIKCLLPEHALDESLVRRFRREALVGMALKGACSVRILGLGTLDPPYEGAPRLPYMVMEHLRGIELGSLLRLKGPLEPALAAGYIAQACSALAEMHALGVVHRDVKPATLFGRWSSCWISGSRGSRTGPPRAVWS
jgi:serine/threonine-protein kinase